jgi:hypothetical protein
MLPGKDRMETPGSGTSANALFETMPRSFFAKRTAWARCLVTSGNALLDGLSRSATYLLQHAMR